jgi:hypothetical protein
MITIREIEEALNQPAEDWKGRCYEISCAVVAAGLVDGNAVYGHYRGSIAPGSMFDRGGLKLARHGWIRTTTNIVDVTRWVFESVKPYVFVTGLSNSDYDEGGNVLRRAMISPPPSFFDGREVKSDGRVTDAEWDTFTEIVGGDGRLTMQQLAWVANLPVDEFQDPKLVYAALSKLGMQAFVPIDNWHMVMG